MKFTWLSILLVFCLCGCSVIPSAPPQTSEVPTLRETEPVGLYQPESHLQQLTGGALKVFPLGTAEATAIGFFGEDLLIRQEDSLQLLSGNSRYIAAIHLLPASADGVQILDSGIAYRDPESRQILVLDSNLKETGRIRLPDDLTGTPILSADGASLFYCTSDGIRVLETDSGLHRPLRQMQATQPELLGIHWGDSILECRVKNDDGYHRLFLSAEDGSLLWDLPETATVTATKDFFCCVRTDDGYREILCGSDPQDPYILETAMLTPEVFPLPEIRGALLASYQPETDSTALKLYNLDTGAHTASLAIPGQMLPVDVLADPAGNSLWFLLPDPETSIQNLCRWELSDSPSGDAGIWLKLYREQDPAEFQECLLLAEQLAQKHGIHLLIGQEAIASQPWDYLLEAETRVPVIRFRLAQLDEALSAYPPDFLSRAVTDGKITFSLVRSITGKADTGATAQAAGVQYWDDLGHTQLVLSSREDPNRTVHHELFHIFESRVFSACNAYDTWHQLNPPGFSYDYNYTDYPTHSDSPLLSGESRAFIDSYSMTFPREDRARIMEYAMLPDRQDCFSSDIMQRKLRTLCIGLREAFGLTQNPQALPWEQYLTEPLT